MSQEFNSWHAVRGRWNQEFNSVARDMASCSKSLTLAATRGSPLRVEPLPNAPGHGAQDGHYGEQNNPKRVALRVDLFGAEECGWATERKLLTPAQRCARLQVARPSGQVRQQLPGAKCTGGGFVASKGHGKRRLAPGQEKQLLGHV